MRQNRLKVAIAVGALLLQSTQVFGASINYNLRMKVDNQYFTPREVNGTDLRPIVHEGTTYLPVRALGTVLGMDRFEINEVI